MKLQTLISYILLLAVFASCIALEDDFSPSISSMEIEENKVFHYKDTFNLSVTFSDNVLISEATISIGEVNPESSSVFTFSFDSTYADIQARALAIDSSLVIPAYVPTGQYFLALKNKDAGDNVMVDSIFFRIESDTILPSFSSDFSVMSAIEGNQESTVYCRGERLLLSGILSDNIGLTKLSVQFADSSPRNFLIQGDSLDINDIVQRQIFIPESLENGIDTLTLTLEDEYSNVSVKKIPLEINCDDVAANFASYESTQEIPSDRIVLIYPGTPFQLTSLIAEDEGGLDSVQLEVSRIPVSSDGSTSTPIIEQFVEVALNGVNTIDLATLEDLNFNFEFDELTTDAGETIFINVKIKDQEQTWDNASFFRFSLVAREDLAPSITVTDFIFNDTKEYVPENEPYALTPQTNSINIKLEGKIYENVGLQSVLIEFIDLGLGSRGTSASKTVTEFSSYPVDLGSLISDLQMVVPSMNQADLYEYSQTDFRLRILATDIRGQTDEIIYNFSVDYSLAIEEGEGEVEEPILPGRKGF
ncbi:DUF4625 domain-containing protein [Flammeovirga sp. SubArs3]|uniref:DUF4625 domain-containing protein n=1 Tax=Flammeovirga sp. SubArs3 TaxID=2995316 RepID=UPI00248ADCDF|nr:DUF4625 domain-containing protein [Flammeovirga sp. SubArs3]